MKNKKLLSLLLIASVIVLCLGSFVACNKKGYDIPSDMNVNIDIYNDTELLGTITNSTLSNASQEIITMTTTNSYGTTTTTSYVAYSFTSLIEQLKITLPDIVSIKTVASDGYESKLTITSFKDAFLSIGFEENKQFVADEKAPRLISDKNSTSSNTVTKFISKIYINLAEIDNTKPVLTVNMVQGSKSNDISVPNSKYATPVNNVSYDYTKNNVTTTYYGFNLSDIIASMGKITKSNEWMSFLEDYAYVGFKCSDDTDDTDYSTRVFTKEEIESTSNYIKVVYDVENNCTRVYSDFDDVLYRSKLKKVTTIIVYNADNSVNAELSLSWGY